MIWSELSRPRIHGWDILLRFVLLFHFMDFSPGGASGFGPVDVSLVVHILRYAPTSMSIIAEPQEVMPSIEDIKKELPSRWPANVLMARRPVADNRWIDHRWEAVGIVLGEGMAQGADPGRTVLRRDGVQEVLHKGFSVELHKDECESYYHNLQAPRPCCYVLTRPGEADGVPEPFLISVSFDEANAYQETDDVDAFPVDMPPELYRWMEAFVLSHYAPEPRRKRKRSNWRESGR